MTSGFDELVSIPRWVNWRAKPRGDGRLTKIPVVNGRAVDVTDSANWLSYADAQTAVLAGAADGVGFVFNGDGLVGVDLDGCVNPDGTLTPEAQDIYARLDSYTEISPSGRGLHIFVRCKLTEPLRLHEGGVEVYSHNRFFTVTARVYGEPKPIRRDATQELGAIVAEHSKHKAGEDTPPPAVSAVANDDLPTDEADLPEGLLDVLDWARRAKNKDKFNTLWAGRWEELGRYKSQSEAELALTRMFCPFTQDRGDLERLVAASPLAGGRDKWRSRPDYRASTVGEALGQFFERQAKEEQERGLKGRRILSEREADMKVTGTHWLIEGWLPRGVTGVLFGASGVGKSFLCVDWGMTLAHELPDWFGCRVEPCPVAYLAGEDAEGVALRARGWRLKYGVDPTDDRFALAQYAVPLNGANAEEAKKAVDDTLKSIEESGLATPGLLVIDTLVRHLSGDENSATDVTRLLDSVDNLKRRLGGPAVLLVAHTGVSGEAQNRVRGSSALKGAVELELKVEAIDEQSFKLVPTKVKNGLAPKPLCFRREPIVVQGVLDNFLQSVSTATLELIDEPGGSRRNKNGAAALTLARNTYIEAARAGGEFTPNGSFLGVRNHVWFEVYSQKCALVEEDTDTGKYHEKLRKAFQRAKDGLVNRGKLAKAGPSGAKNPLFSPLNINEDWPELSGLRTSGNT